MKSLKYYLSSCIILLGGTTANSQVFTLLFMEDCKRVMNKYDSTVLDVNKQYLIGPLNTKERVNDYFYLTDSVLLRTSNYCLMKRPIEYRRTEERLIEIFTLDSIHKDVYYYKVKMVNPENCEDKRDIIIYKFTAKYFFKDEYLILISDNENVYIFKQGKQDVSKLKLKISYEEIRSILSKDSVSIQSILNSPKNITPSIMAKPIK